MQDYIFTFGEGHEMAGKCVRVTAENKEEARKKMMDKYGTRWAFQYEIDEWERMKKEEWFAPFMEKEVEF